MWTPFKAIPKRIKILKKSLIQFAEHRGPFLMEDICNRYLEIFKITNGNFKTDDSVIKQQIEVKVNTLIKAKTFRKVGNYILMNHKYLE